MSEPEMATREDHNRRNTSNYGIYSQYQKFDGEWLRKIPEHWDIERFRSNSDYVKGDKPDEVEDSKFRKYDTPYLSMEYLRGEISNPEFANSDEDGLVTANKNDILLLWDGSKAGEFVRAKNGVVSSTMAKLLLKGDHNPNYIYYQLKIVEDFLQNTTVGMGIPHVNPQILNNIKLAIPPKEEQDAIVKFLDQETERVDQLIKQKQNLIDLIQEQEEALITKITKEGLEDDVETKESTDEIIGSIPINWEEAKLGNITVKLTNGYVGPTRDILVDQGVPYIQSTHIENGELEFNGEFYVTEEWSKNHRTSRLKKGDVLLVQTGVNIGESAVVKEELDGANCHALIIARPVEEVNSLFLNLFLQSKLGKNLLKRTQTGATLKHLNTTSVTDVVIPVPPKEEQKEIVGYLENKREESKVAIDKISEGIERLKEYRTALITEAVTGQINVQGEV